MGLQVAVEELVESFLDFSLYFIFRVAHFGEKVGIFAGGEAAFAVVEDGHVGNHVQCRTEA